VIRRRTSTRTAIHGEQALKWLIALASLNIQDFARGRPGDLPNLVYDLERWLGVYDDTKLAGQIRKLLQRPALLQPIIHEVSALVAAVADLGKFNYRYSDGHVEVDGSRLEKESGRAVSYRFTDLLDAVMHVAIHDLTRHDAVRVRRCREQSCHKVFLASRRSQIYCSHRCANLQASRTYRSANAPKRAERERQRYRAMVLRRIGSRSIRVGRDAGGQKK
jgi:predicted RNA-binding Zn ribbon-like protein